MNQLAVGQKKALELTPFWEMIELCGSALGRVEENLLLEFYFIVFPGTEHYPSPVGPANQQSAFNDKKHSLSNYKAFINTPPRTGLADLGI